jgi:hypothetical protein
MFTVRVIDTAAAFVLFTVYGSMPLPRSIDELGSQGVRITNVIRRFAIHALWTWMNIQTIVCGYDRHDRSWWLWWSMILIVRDVVWGERRRVTLLKAAKECEIQNRNLLSELNETLIVVEVRIYNNTTYILFLCKERSKINFWILFGLV